MSENLQENKEPTASKPPSGPAGRDMVLELSFVPEWARKPPPKNPYADFKGREERGAGRGRDRGRGRKPREGERRDRKPPHGRRPEGDRGGRPRGRREERRPREHQRPSPPPLPPVEVSFIPERAGLNALVQQLKASGRAYPLNELTNLFLSRPEYHAVKFEMAHEKDKPVSGLYQCAATGELFLSRDEAMKHIQGHGLDAYFDVEEVETDPPRGNFVCVARCPLSGTLLGPPNHHSFKKNVEALHRKRFSHMSLEAYRAKIENVNDEELIEQWKQESRKKTIYRLKGEKSKEEPAAESNAEPVEEPEEPSTKEATEEPVPEQKEEATGEPAEASGEESTGEPAQQLEEEPVEAPSEEPGAEPKPEASRGGFSRKEAEAYFMEHLADTAVTETTRLILPAKVTRVIRNPGLQRALREAWNRETRRPFSLKMALRPALRHMGFNLFRANGRAVFVTPIKPNPIRPSEAAETIGEVLDYLHKHPGCTRQQLVEGLRPGKDPAGKEVSEVLSPLRWLTERGHVIEFYNGTLSVPQLPAA